MATREQIIAAARAYIGTPFRHQGRVKGRGVDCAGLIFCVCQELGVKLPYERYLNYEPYSINDGVLHECRFLFKEIGIDQIRPGDIICMHAPRACHVGFVSSLPPSLSVLHAWAPNRKVVEHVLSAEWLQQHSIAGAFLFPGVED